MWCEEGVVCVCGVERGRCVCVVRGWCVCVEMTGNNDCNTTLQFINPLRTIIL